MIVRYAFLNFRLAAKLFLSLSREESMLIVKGVLDLPRVVYRVAADILDLSVSRLVVLAITLAIETAATNVCFISIRHPTSSCCSKTEITQHYAVN